MIYKIMIFKYSMEKEERNEVKVNDSLTNKSNAELVNGVPQEQIHGILFNRELGWQEIIYDLINTEQLDPWDINISLLADKYLERIENMPEVDFFVSSKVLLAASLLLRIKSEILLNKYLKSIDEILFEKKELKKHTLERIELDEDIPELVLRTPLPRFKKVTLKELMESLGKAITTENRRVNKVILNSNAVRETSFSLPKKTFKLKDKIREIYSKIYSHFTINESQHKISFNQFALSRDEKLISFSPLLHLEHQKKLWLEQEAHFEEIYIWLEETHLKHHPNRFADLKQEIEEEIMEEALTEAIDEEIQEETKNKKNITREKKKRLKNIDKHFKNPLGDITQ
jgi:segregation and condensation protein A